MSRLTQLFWISRWLLPVSLVCLVAPAPLAAQDRADSLDRRQAEMVRRIDELIARRWSELGIEPAEKSSDAEFLRRVYLDLTGVVPRVTDSRQFHADTSPDKRQRLIEQLLRSPAHATHMANTWRQFMLPVGLGPEQLQSVIGVQNWLREQFSRNLRYDRMVADLLVSTGGGDTGPALFYTAQDLQPEKLAASTARIFMGLQIECAECHDHPSDRWKQEDFWAYAAFFARLRQSEMMVGVAPRLVDLDRGEVQLPETDDDVAPRYPGSDEPADAQRGTRRMQLAIWLSARDNPYLARAAVNRLWALMFGRGLVEPVDDLGPYNPASHPQLLDELADYFVDTGFDIRRTLATLAMTETYQLSSRVPGSAAPPEAFAAMNIKPLTPEQAYDSMARALLQPTTPVDGQSRFLDPQRLQFLIRMEIQNPNSREYQSGVPQALTMMNGDLVTVAADPGQSSLLQALEAPFFTDEDKLETLFLAALARPPAAEEQAELLQLMRVNPPLSSTNNVLSDILWALLNSAEFALNH